MKEILAALVEAQRLDERLAVLRRRLESLPAELGERDSRQAVREAEAEALEGKRRAALLRARELESEVRGLEERVTTLERKARGLRDAGAVQVAEHEAQELRDRISRGQDEEFRLLEDADRLQAEGARARAELVESLAELTRFRASVEADVAELRAQVAELEAERDSLLARVPSSTAEVYRKLLPARNGRAVCALKGTSCGGCGMVVPPNDRVGVVGCAKLVRCRSCMRIMVAPEIWSAQSPA